MIHIEGHKKKVGAVLLRLENVLIFDTPLLVSGAGRLDPSLGPKQKRKKKKKEEKKLGSWRGGYDEIINRK